MQKSIISNSIDVDSQSIWGMGGVGTTLLVQMSYNSQEVCQRFEGAKLISFTITQTPNIKGLYDSLWRELDLHLLNLVQLEEYRTKLYNEFSRRRVFLVLNDVWKEGGLEQFDLANGQGSIALVIAKKTNMCRRILEW